MRGGLWSLAAVVWFLVGAPVTQGVALRWEKGELTYLDLQPKANTKLTEALQNGRPANTLKDLPRGEQKLGGVKFKISDRLIQLQGTGSVPVKGAARYPAKVEGIRVGRTFAKLFILHAAGRCQGVKDGAVLGQYVVHYRDQTQAAIKIVYGKDVRDWWELSDARKVTRAKVAWKGANPVLRQKTPTKVRLYLTTWVNPQPKKEVARIDYVCKPRTPAWLFCVAMSMEGK
jgi:hypothetical protein